MTAPTLARAIAGRIPAFADQPLPEASLRMARRVLADALGCALAMADRPDGAGSVAARALTGVRGPLQATLLTGGRAWAPAAAFVNGALLRDSEMSDTWRGPTPGHHSELIPAALALCEARGLSGEHLLRAIVFGYELYARLCATARIVGGGRGWHHTTWGIVATPAVAAFCLELPTEAAAHAIACSASYGLTTNALHLGSTTGLRSVVFPLAACSGTLCALLAAEGLQGPLDAIEGEQGLLRQLVGDDFDPAPLADWSEPLILRTNLKRYACSYLMHSALHALQSLMAAHGLGAGDLERIDVELTPRPYEVVAQPGAHAPRTPQEADHSLPFCLALVARRGHVLPGDFDNEALADDTLLQLAARVHVRRSDGLARQHAFEQDWPARVTVRAAGGTFQETCIRPPGDHRQPLADDALLAKFTGLTGRRFAGGRAARLWQLLMALDGTTPVRELAQLLRPDFPEETPA